MDERQAKAVEQAIACGIQHGRELHVGSCFDRALKHTTEAAGVPLTEDLLWQLDLRLDELVARHNAMGTLTDSSLGAGAGTLPLRPTAGPSQFGARHLQARCRALLADPLATGTDLPAGRGAGGRRCLYVTCFCLLALGYAVTPSGRSLTARAYDTVQAGWQEVLAVLSGQTEEPALTQAAPEPGHEAAPPPEPVAVPAPAVAAEAAVAVAVDGAAGSPAPDGQAAAPVAALPAAQATAAETAPTVVAAAASTPAPPPAPAVGLEVVNPGMTRAAVVERLGRPRMAIGSNGRETLIYPFGRVVLADGVVTRTTP